ncbi:MAG: hypothetical protein R3C59_19565 [Planctomycetaceae bacterium]
MAPCDQGYLCDICGEEVQDIRDSDLYLRFVTGRIDAQKLLSTPERHLNCNPVDAQYIVADEFPPVTVDGPFAKSELDPQYVAHQERLLTRGWHRLQELFRISETLPLSDYPLDEFRTPR